MYEFKKNRYDDIQTYNENGYFGCCCGCVLCGMLKTFEYGAAIFSEEAMAPYGKGVEVVVTIPNDTSAGELGKILQKNGLIKDAGIFKIQAFLYDLTITPGTYEFSTENNVEDIIDIINANKPKKEEKSGD